MRLNIYEVCEVYAIYVMYEMRLSYYIYSINLVTAESESYEGNDIYEGSM